jgi:hypothetical protein
LPFHPWRFFWRIYSIKPEQPNSRGQFSPGALQALQLNSWQAQYSSAKRVRQEFQANVAPLFEGTISHINYEGQEFTH